ncbi:MAG: prepilin-type N-terminal cleavage/methylation domain-containing protein [Proteobacteria bacterium]|nr:prepilin-type N-terminal cleavage/methylation domain-containing protein [Pseudomonadota bacterium]
MTDILNPVADRRSGRYLSRGLTLLEVLIALVIIATVLVGLVELGNQDIRALNSSRRMNIAAMLARNMIAQIELAGFPEDLEEEEGDFTEEGGDEELEATYVEGFRWKRLIEAARFGGVTYENARRVTVTITWSEGKREKQLDVVMYIARRDEKT